MLVGVISDIHGHLSEQAYDALQPCDMILCAGDVERPTILMEL
ncbi:MAG: metallophosphoesterase family protein, partial [Eggerthella sp.]|nr:metallophosphoesterase family protein [Eggerthella sp.]